MNDRVDLPRRLRRRQRSGISVLRHPDRCGLAWRLLQFGACSRWKMLLAPVPHGSGIVG